MDYSAGVHPENSRQEKTILCLVIGAEGYGVRRAWGGLISGFLHRGFRPVVAALEEGDLARKLAAYGAMLTVSPKGVAANPASTGPRKAYQMARRGLSQIGRVGWLATTARRERAHAILFRSPSEVILAGLAARRAGIRAYWLLPNSISDYPLDFNRRVYRFAFRRLNVVPVSNSAYTDTTIGPGDFERHVVHLGIDPVDFPLLAETPGLRAELNIAENAVVIGIFARMVREKGQLRMLEAIAALGSDGSGIHLLLCGGPIDTAYAAEIRSFAQDHGMADRITMTGPVSDVQRHYGVCDIVANSRLDPEPFGFSVIESMMLGKPILAHKAGGPGETIVDGRTGWLIDGPDLASFVAGLRRALADRDRWDEIGQSARTHAIGRFNHQRMADDLLAIMTGPND